MDERDVSAARVGDWLEVKGVAGGPPRRGMILEVLRRAERAHYRVQWDEGYESLVYPTEAIVHHPARQGDRSA